MALILWWKGFPYCLPGCEKLLLHCVCKRWFEMVGGDGMALVRFSRDSADEY